jgi:hypothetical protein
MNAKTRKPAKSTEKVRFEDLDIVYVIPFDLGAPVKAKDLGEWFSKRKLVEGVWIPPSDGYEPTSEFIYRKAKELGIKNAEKISAEELMKNKKLEEEINREHTMFKGIISKDILSCNPVYLKSNRYVRLKLTDLHVSIKDKELRYLEELKCELYLLLHNAGVGVLTAWIHLDGGFSTDDVIEIERKLDNAKCMIKLPFGKTEEGTLREFIDMNVISPLQAAIAFSSEYKGFDAAYNAWKEGNISDDRLKKKLRLPYSIIYTVVCIRGHKCQDGCVTAEDAVERHLREIVGILTRYENWRYYRMDSAKKDLGENLSSDVDYAMFVTIGTSLFMGSTLLDERLKSEKKNKEIAYRSAEFILVHSVEFLLLSDMILDVYTSVYRNKFEELRERRRREETVRPSEIAEIRKDLMYGLEEYNSISLFSMDPDRSIMEYGKKN